jgi:hypothetical protein
MKKETVFRAVLAAAIFFLVYQFGVKPILNNSGRNHATVLQDWSVQLEQGRSADYDVIVFGAEPQGISAAISASRLGARTLLISEGMDAGGTVTGCLLPELEVPVSRDSRLLNGGILQEFYDKLDSGFSDSKYISTVNSMLGAEKNLRVLYNTSIQSINMTGMDIESLKLLSNGEAKVISGRIFIDASESGQLLDVCKVPYFTGSGDLNLPDSFVPVNLNFEMVPSDVDQEKVAVIKKLVNNKTTFYEGIKKYKPLNLHARLDELNLFFPGDGSVIFKGLQVSGVNVLAKGELDNAYVIAMKEAKNLAQYMTEHFKQFKGWKLSRTAPDLQVRESRHYSGKVVLTVNDVLDNKYFEDTVAMGSYPVLSGKFTNNGAYITGKPSQYGIPLGCLVPVKITNLLMAGPHISYSSLAATSAGTMGTSIATGEAAGAAAVFCLIKNESPAFLENKRENLDELREILTAQKMYLPNQKIANRNEGNWSYPDARQLISLGLVAGGANNNLRFNTPAKQEDLAFVLLNGIYRLDKESYSLEMDVRIRPFITGDVLTYDNAVKMLGALYEIAGDTDAVYKKLCEQRRINDVMQLRMKDRKPLSMDDVYYLGAHSIRSYTGKDIPG